MFMSKIGRCGKALRQCPDDFEAMFVRLGRLECEEHYHAARLTIDRWLSERDKQRLIKERAEFVKNRRSQNARQAKLKRDIARVIRGRGRSASPSVALT